MNAVNKHGGTNCVRQHRGTNSVKQHGGANLVKHYGGMALVFIGAILLFVCYVTDIETNVELLVGLALILVGFILHVYTQR